MAVSDEDLVRYSLGMLPKDVAAIVRHEIETTPELKARLGLLSPFQHKPKRFGRLQSRGFRYFALTILLLCVPGAGWSIWQLVRTKPLLEDNFRDEWLDTRIWDTHRGRKGIREEDGYLRLLNRGSLVTQAAFREPIEIELDWCWIDLASDPLYPDILSVGLRTSGQHETKHAYQLRDGVLVSFMPHGGVVRITNLQVSEGSEGSTKASAAGEAKFSSGKWYHLRITDDGKHIEVFLSGPEIDKKYEREPIITMDIIGEYTDKRAAFFNREYVGGSNHESRIDNMLIRRSVGK